MANCEAASGSESFMKGVHFPKHALGGGFNEGRQDLLAGEASRAGGSWENVVHAGVRDEGVAEGTQTTTLCKVVHHVQGVLGHVEAFDILVWHSAGLHEVLEDLADLPDLSCRASMQSQ